MMTSADGRPADEVRRLASVASVVGVISDHVADIAQILPQDIPDWLQRMEVPSGWQMAALETSTVSPSRTLVCGARAHSGWDACDTVSMFRFTGMPPLGLVEDNNDCTLRSLAASAIVEHSLIAPTPLVCAVRSSGYFTAAGRRLWAQYSTYLAAVHPPEQGLLVVHNVFVNADCRSRLRDDVGELSDAVLNAFLAVVDTVDNHEMREPMQGLEVSQDGA